MLALASNLALGTGNFIYACVDSATGTPDVNYAIGIRPTYSSSGATDYCVAAMPGYDYVTPDHTDNACCRLLSDGLTSLSIELYDMNIFTANDITGSATLTDLSETSFNPHAACLAQSSSKAHLGPITASPEPV